MTTGTIGGIDRASSYDLYKAVVAVDMLCVRSSPPLQGIATQIGEFSFFVSVVVVVAESGRYWIGEGRGEGEEGEGEEGRGTKGKGKSTVRSFANISWSRCRGEQTADYFAD